MPLRAFRTNLLFTSRFSRETVENILTTDLIA